MVYLLYLYYKWDSSYTAYLEGYIPQSLRILFFVTRFRTDLIFLDVYLQLSAVTLIFKSVYLVFFWQFGTKSA